MRMLLLVAAVSTAALASVNAQAQDMSPGVVDVVEVASAADNYGTFLQAALKADLAEPLATRQDVTIFAPIDAAFTSVEDLDAVLADKEKLAGLLNLHVVPTAYLSSELADGETSVRTLDGQSITIRNDNGQISIRTPSGAEAMVVQADLRADNGVVHGIDTVLMP